MMVIAFRKVREEYGWLGNMAPIDVRFEGKTWRTAEALFQALRFEAREVREAIRAQKSPMSAKMVAKRHAALRVVEPTSAQDVENMRLVVRAKFEQHVTSMLRLVRTGEAQIVEDCTNRRASTRSLFWGAAQNADGSWEGANTLGIILMKLREEFQEEVRREEAD
jgi:ribA/ribD-fused uncharacterized protein